MPSAGRPASQNSGSPWKSPRTRLQAGADLGNEPYAVYSREIDLYYGLDDFGRAQSCLSEAKAKFPAPAPLWEEHQRELVLTRRLSRIYRLYALQDSLDRTGLARQAVGPRSKVYYRPIEHVDVPLKLLPDGLTLTMAPEYAWTVQYSVPDQSTINPKTVELKLQETNVWAARDREISRRCSRMLGQHDELRNASPEQRQAYRVVRCKEFCRYVKDRWVVRLGVLSDEDSLIWGGLREIPPVIVPKSMIFRSKAVGQARRSSSAGKNGH